MRHARKDYDRIQDPAGLIPEDEPVFLLRAQDKTAAQVLRLWAQAQRQNPKADFRLIQMVEQHANAMDAWQKKKWADIPPTA